MPKRAMIFLAALSLGLAVAACHSYSTPTSPTPGPSVTFSPNPNITAATIQVNVRSTPAANIPVQESTPLSTSSPRPGTTIITLRTRKNGQAKFTHLKPAQTYCWVAILGPNQMSSRCAPFQIWQSQTITLGTP
jgi:hypothetical protein